MKRTLVVVGLVWAVVFVPAVGQESVEDLLKRLDQQEGAPPTESPAFSLPTLDLSPSSFRAPPAIHLYRAADPVQVVQQGTLRNLQYWDSHFQLQRGDEVRLGPKARTVVDYPDGAHLALDGPAVLRVGTGPEESPRHLALPVLGKLAVIHLYEVQTSVDLPAGHRLTGSAAQITLRVRDLKDLIVRNTGPGAVELEGQYLPSGRLTLVGGQEVVLALFPIPGRGPTGEVTEVVVDSGVSAEGRGVPMKVRAPAEVAIDDRAPSVLLRGRGPTAGVVLVAGARIVVPPGREILARRASLGLRRDEER